MTTSQNSEATLNVQSVAGLAAPAGLNLLGDADAGTCCGGACAVPAE